MLVTRAIASHNELSLPVKNALDRESSQDMPAVAGPQDPSDNSLTD